MIGASPNAGGKPLHQKANHDRLPGISKYGQKLVTRARRSARARPRARARTMPPLVK
jgi:hypothetical protein